MYQENSQRKWQSAAPVPNPPLDNLKTFIQKRIRAIMAKEWWDFIVNVNTLNSDHASLLYSLANLCPSFNYFLQTRDKELQLIIKKRPVVKPRIFSGSERSDMTPEPIVPKQLPLVTRRNSATELVKILNELYPNENSTKNKPRTYGPASKQKKSPPAPVKKNPLAFSTGADIIKATPKGQAALGRTPLLKRLLADESQKENAHITNVKKVPQVLSLPVLLEDDEQFSKAILSNTNYDLNQNRCLDQAPRKIKKIIKVKKKRYVYSNALSADSKHRLKYILEDETPNLSLKLIKKYRIKKCTVDVVRLKHSVLKYYEDLRWSNYEKLRLSLQEAESSSSISNEDMEISTSEDIDQVNSYVTSSNVNTNPPSDSNPLSEPQVGSASASSPLAVQPPSEKRVENASVSSPIAVQPPSEKDEEVSENSVSSFCKEDTPTVDKLNPRELKNMYCHGGIVPLGKLLMSDKVANNKHFVSLKEKKLRDVSNNAPIILKPKDGSTKSENGEVEANCNSSDTKHSELDRLHSFEPSSKDSSIDSTVLEDGKSSTKAVFDDANSSNVKTAFTSSEDTVVNEIPLVLNVSKSCFNTNVADEAVETIKCNGNVNTICDTRQNGEANVYNGEKNLDIDDVVVDLLDEVQRNKTISELEKIIGANDKSETISDSLDQNETNQILERLIIDTLANRSEDIEEPLTKRPRIEINLSKMKLETDVAKIPVEEVALGSIDDRVCKMCKSSFESPESWNDHFVNKVPKCTPNLQVTWDNPELSLLTD